METKYAFIKERVLHIAKIKGISKEKFLADIGMTYGSFKGEAKKGTLNSDAIAKVYTNYPEINPEWLLIGEGPMMRRPEPQFDGILYDPVVLRALASGHPKPRKKKPTGLIAYYETDFSAAAPASSDEESAHPAYYMDIPEFAGCIAFRLYSNAMEPTIQSGSILFASRIASWQTHLEYGQAYGIACLDGRRYITYIHKDSSKRHSDCFLLRSPNPSYEEFTIPKTEIRNLWLVQGWMVKRA